MFPALSIQTCHGFLIKKGVSILYRKDLFTVLVAAGAWTEMIMASA